MSITLSRGPQLLESALINTPISKFQLPPIKGRANQNRNWGLETNDLMGKVSLVNIFGSWCSACKVEHTFLMHLKKLQSVPIHGINWREENSDDGPNWLKKYGDPYTLVGDDPRSVAAIAFGVTKAPETFVVDKKGFIRYKHIGPLNAQAWDKVIFPMIQDLQKR